MELTLQQRIDGYEFALESIQKDYGSLICPCLLSYLVYVLGIRGESVLHLFPEFAEYDPARRGFLGASWFKSREERIDVLQNIILKLKKNG